MDLHKTAKYMIAGSGGFFSGEDGEIDIRDSDRIDSTRY